MIQKDTHASTKIFGGFEFFLFAVVPRYLKKSKMKILSAFQLATKKLTF